MVRISKAHIIFVSILSVSILIFVGVFSSHDNVPDTSAPVSSIIQDGSATTATITTSTSATAVVTPFTGSSDLAESAKSASSITKSNASNDNGTNDTDSSKGITVTNGKTKVLTSSSTISLPYLHCGHIFYTNGSFDPTTDVEIILLHGAAFTKQDWEHSGILQSLCTNGNRPENGAEQERRISVVALDLSVKSTGDILHSAVHALYKHANVLSGTPPVVVSPSASGKAMVELAQYYHENSTQTSNGGLLKKTASVWITVASPAVLSPKVQDSELRSYVTAEIPVLAIHGDEDKMGRKVTKRLVNVVNAEGVELTGKHPCYLDSPGEFVTTVLDFVDRKLLRNGDEGE